MNFQKNDHSNRSNGQVVLGFIFCCKNFLTRAANSLRLGSFNPHGLREIAVDFLLPRARVSG